MNPAGLNVRRAVVDDLPQLLNLWKIEKLPWEILEKRFTEFQVAVDSNNQVIGAIGLHIVGHEGLMHSEAFLRFDLADTIREMIWERIEVIAHNFGLVRIWTREDSPFWHHYGFRPATNEQLQKLPKIFGTADSGWYVATFRKEEPPKVISPEKEFEILIAQEKAETQRITDLAKIMRVIAVIIAALLLLGVVIMGVYIVTKLPAGK
jgi:N-acetylglutamate synthase-like GNAT family acetyltransferase